jgi:hypothetical protein
MSESHMEIGQIKCFSDCEFHKEVAATISVQVILKHLFVQLLYVLLGLGQLGKAFVV